MRQISAVCQGLNVFDCNLFVIIFYQHFRVKRWAYWICAHLLKPEDLVEGKHIPLPIGDQREEETAVLVSDPQNIDETVSSDFDSYESEESELNTTVISAVKKSTNPFLGELTENIEKGKAEEVETAPIQAFEFDFLLKIACANKLSN